MKFVSSSVLFLLILISIFKSGEVLAQQPICDNRFVTLINPVRGRDLWIDKTTNPLKEQYNLIKQYNFPTTWLFQYDVLLDQSLLDEINKFDSKQERGVFLEVSQNFAEQSRVLYPNDVPWFSPRAVFLSGYSQSDRRKLVDKLFKEFKLKFGFYPKSVGAWWIDSYSLNYMKDKYDIKSALIVADQKNTDNYGIWGQWWGVPYYPAKANVLTPASSSRNKLDVVILQWAQRDPELAIGEGTNFSNFSLQANDYIRQGRNIDYFQRLMNIYLDCQNPLGQVTVGLETGSDSVLYFEEYRKQLEVLKNLPTLQLVTMEQFYQKFSRSYPTYPKKNIIEKENSQWVMTPEERSNKIFNEVTFYNPNVSFDDYFVAKKDQFLDRILPVKTKQENPNLQMPFSLITMFFLGLYAYFKKKAKLWLISTLFTLASYGLILRSYSQFGWEVYYGSPLKPLHLYQIVLPVITFLIFLFLNRFRNLNLWLISLSFAFDPLIQNFKVSFISEKYYFGFSLDALRFLGISLTKDFKLEFVNTDFPGYLAAGLLKFDFAKIWQNLPSALLVYPLAHIFLGIILTLVLKRFFKIERLIIPLLFYFFLLHIWMVFNANPFAVQSLR